MNKDDNKKLVYLEWNVIISLAEGELPDLLQHLIAARDTHKILIPFSATHIQELDNIPKTKGFNSDFANSRLEFISNISQDVYIYNATDVKTPVLHKEHPKSVQHTINEVSWAKPAIHDALNLFGFDHMKQCRRELQLDPNELNNITPPGVIDKLDNIVTLKVQKLSNNKTQEFGVKMLLETSLKFYPNSETLGFESKMAAVFSALNWLGFWPDKKEDTSMVASFNDASHAAVAAYTHYFVTDDIRLRLKSMAAYELFGIKTKVLNSSELSSVLTKMST